MFFDIRKQKFLEALDSNDKGSAVEILRNDLKVFSVYDENIYQEMCQLLTLENFRENGRLSNYKDAQTSRRKMVIFLKKLIEANPVFREKLVFPSFSVARLSTIVNQSLNLQHCYCEFPRPFPTIETLFTDHVCEPLNVVMASTSAVVPSATVVNRNAYPSPGVHSCGDEPRSSNIEESRTSGVPEETRPLQLSEITLPDQFQQVTMPQGSNVARKVLRVVYPHSGSGLCALGSDGILTVWKWPSDEQNPCGKATARVLPQQWKPESPYTENVMATEHARGMVIDDRVACLALSHTDNYVLSAYGGAPSIFSMRTFKKVVAMPSPTTTCVQFYPLDNNILAVGLDNSTVSIYQVIKDEEIAILEGHRRGITGLAFSTHLNILVSAGGDGVLCSWNTDTWVKVKSVPVNMLAAAPLSGETGVQFHPDHVHLLVTQQKLLAVYDASRMECIKEWSLPVAFMARVTCATYSGDGQLVYPSFCDGSVWVFEASTLRPRCRIALSAYHVVPRVNGSEAVYPLAIAAHPQERNQFAIGLTDGSLRVIEPLESEREWGKRSGLRRALEEAS